MTECVKNEWVNTSYMGLSEGGKNKYGKQGKIWYDSWVSQYESSCLIQNDTTRYKVVDIV